MFNKILKTVLLLSLCVGLSGCGFFWGNSDIDEQEPPEIVRPSFASYETCNVIKSTMYQLRSFLGNFLYESDGSNALIFVYQGDPENSQGFKVGDKGKLSFVPKNGVDTLEFDAVLTQVADGGTGRYVVDILSEDFSENLTFFGQSGTFTIVDSQTTDVLMVPSSCITSFAQTGKQIVRIINEDTLTISEVVVKTGESSQGYTQIISGLSEGDKIVKG